VTASPSETARRTGRLSDERPQVPAGWRVALGVGATLLVALGVVVLIAKAAGFGRVREATEDAE